MSSDDDNCNIFKHKLLALSSYNDPPSKRFKKASQEDDLICPITLELPFDPVMADDDQVYERSAIEQHFQAHQGAELISPVTRKTMTQTLFNARQHKNIIKTLIDNGSIAGPLAEKWKEKEDDQKKGEELLKKARAGDSDAMYRVGCGHIFGKYGMKIDAKLAFSWMKKAHLAGDVRGTGHIGDSLLDGIGVEICSVQGLVYTTMAAMKGSDVAAYKLGMAMAKGEYGLHKNIEEAKVWLQKSCDGSCSIKSLKGCSIHEAKKKLQEIKEAETLRNAQESFDKDE